MPVSTYYGGKGESVLRQMIRKYGKKRGKAIFYATSNKYGIKVKEKHDESRPHKEEPGREGHRS